MIFETYIPDEPALSGVEIMIYYKHFKPDHSIERVVPTGHTFLLFELDGFVRHTYDSDTLEPDAEWTISWFSGPMDKFLSISAHQDSEMLAIQFKPYGCLPFTHQPLEQFYNRVVGSEQVFGSDLSDVQSNIRNAAGYRDKFNAVEKWLIDRMNSHFLPPEILLNCVDTMNIKKGEFGPASEDYPASQKHMIQEFKKYIGLTPKTYLRVVRFNQILQRINRKEKISWAEIAFGCGYSDQSHFIKEFKRFSGFNPSEFIDQDYHQTEPNFFPLDKI